MQPLTKPRMLYPMETYFFDNFPVGDKVPYDCAMKQNSKKGKPYLSDMQKVPMNDCSLMHA